MTTQALTVIEPLPLPTLRQPTPELPAWVESLQKCVVNEYGDTFSDNPYPGTSRKWMIKGQPNAVQRAELENSRAALVALLDQKQTPAKSQEAWDSILVPLGELMLAFPHRAGDAAASKARAKAFMFALDDIPAWATERAISNWYKGKCDSWDFINPKNSVTFDYTWAPGPVDLRRIAERYVAEVRNRIVMFDRILNAPLYVEHTPEQRRRAVAEDRERSYNAAREPDTWRSIDDLKGAA
jgi:hypothetical protein